MSVDVWLVSLPPRVAADTLARCHALLDPAERDRADRFRHDPSRDQFVVARAALRRLLSTYEPAIAPTAWRFAAGPHGKPRLESGSIEFNYAHADGLIVLALSREGPVGVDAESLDRFIDVRHFDRVLSVQERDELRVLDHAAQRRRFLSLWTAKEAYAKAVGSGLSESLAAVTVASAESTPSLRGSFDRSHPWHLHRLEAGVRHVAVLAAASAAAPVVRSIEVDAV